MLNWMLKKNVPVLAMFAATCAMGQTVDGGSVVTGLPNNALTDQERADGYHLLWNGEDYTGTGTDMEGGGLLLNTSTTNPASPTTASNWAIVTIKGYESGDHHKSVVPDSNMLEVVQSGSSLFTNDSNRYRDFDWKMEWQAAVNMQTNSGMLIHYRVSVNTNNNYSAPEYQLCNAEWTSEWKTLTTTAGCNYLITPMVVSRRNSDLSPSWCRAEGHWNQSRIISYGTHTAHYGNGLRLVDYQMFTTAWTAAYNASKYKGLGIYNTLHSGSFYLQDHGEPYVKLRNIRVKRLTQNPWAPGSPYLNLDSAATGDSTLVDSLTFAQDLFPSTTPIVSRYTIVPKYTAKVKADRDGLSILFSQPGNYTLTLEDVHGARFSIHHVSNSNLFFLPGQFSHSPRVLTIWNGDKKIQEGLIGTK